MKSKLNAVMMLALCGILAACTKTGPGSQEVDENVVHDSPYAGLNGKEVKHVYETLTSSSIASLNYLKTSAAANARNFANFLDGLLTHNDFGTLELDLAESASHNEDYTEFTFKVREDPNLIWVNYDGTPYKVNGDVQAVVAEDFVSGAKVVCNYSTGSDTFYLMRDFISGALEYYLLTQIKDGKAQGVKEFTNLNTNTKMAAWINKQIKNNYSNVYKDGGYEDNPVEADHITLIDQGKRLGVTAKDGKVTYTLMKPAMYFPTLLTYSCYLPVNANFYKEKGAKFGTASKDSILYNGPYLLNQLDETNVIFKKNETYAKRADLHGYNTVRVETIKYNIVKSDIDATYTRNQFENGNIDGFSLSPSDTEGWEKYVTGADGSGTLEEPYSGLVNSRLLDTIGYAYGSNLVLERTKNANSKKTFSSKGSEAEIANTERALRLQDVRKAIMAAFDYPTYYKRYADGDSTSVLASQNIVSTYVPKNFVYDDNGNEYTQKYYAEALAAKRGISVEQARDAISVGTWEKRHISQQEQINQLVDKAMAAIEAYNASALANTSGHNASTGYGKITLPIQIEYFSAWSNQETKTYDGQMINSMNKRLNNVTTIADDLSNLTKFRIVPTDLYDDNNADEVSGQKDSAASFDFSPVLWGWGADYGDPLTYLNTYTKGGDWSSIFPYVAYDWVPNIKVNGSEVVEEDLLAAFDAIVKEGQVQNENLTLRYSKFAEAEVMLIEDLAIYMPQTNDGQGWSLSISKAAGYECPTANYGLSNDRLTGLWVLKEPLTREERKAIRAEQDAAKEAWNANHPAYNIY